ncbi:MAG: XylR N-terminal domain-containing protein, partial [Phycisphaerae bacterium]|nr:XylR N-terminal domain-containing protein [Phycisphaerae bacterium]
MKAEQLRLKELVEFSEGLLSLHGRRLVLHDIRAFAQFRKDLVGSLGMEQARRSFTRFGYFWGQEDAAAMKRIFTWDSLEEWLRAGPRMHTLQGVARTVVQSLEFEQEAGRFAMEVVWHDSGEAEEHLTEIGPAKEPVCWMLVGYASGYASFCMGQEVYFIEQKCRAMGDRACIAVGKDAASWGDALKPHLRYFQS